MNDMSNLTLIETFTRERDRLRALARRFLRSDADAEDALQDAFIRLWPKAGSIDDGKHSTALVMTTVRNLAIDRRRKQHMPTIEINSEITAEEKADYNSREELIKDVEAIIERELSATQRRIIHLRDYEGKDYEDIAAELDMQPTAVRMQLSRARKRIREIYNERRR